MTLASRRLSAFVVLAALATTAVACDGDRAVGRQQVGATRDQASGMPSVVVYPCSGQQLSSVTLWLMSKDGNERVRPLWAVSRVADGPSPARVTAGQVPDGFREDTPLVAAIPSDANVEFVAQLGVQAGVEFRARDLQSDNLVVDPAWFGNKRRVSLDRFNQENAKDCRSH